MSAFHLLRSAIIVALSIYFSMVSLCAQSNDVSQEPCPLQVGDRFELAEITIQEGGEVIEALEVREIHALGTRDWVLELKLQLRGGGERNIEVQLLRSRRLPNYYELQRMVVLENGIFGRVKKYAYLSSPIFSKEDLNRDKRVQISNSLVRRKSLVDHLFDLITWRNVPYPESVSLELNLRQFTGDFVCRRSVSSVKD